MAYCGTFCHGEGWSSHSRFCKKLKGFTCGQRRELVTNMILLAGSRKDRRKEVMFSATSVQDKIRDPTPGGGASSDKESVDQNILL